VVPLEWTILGNGVIGVSRDVDNPETGPTYHRRVGTKFYPLTDHLGSVRAVVGDVKLPASGGTFTADVMSVYDYEAYGVPRPGRNLDVRAYWRYGFQGMLKQSELSGSTTDISDYLTPFRSYDARAGRWRSHDPRSVPCKRPAKRPVQTSREAQEMAGNPAMMVDPWGLDGESAEYYGPPDPTRIHEGRSQSYIEGRWVSDFVAPRPVEVTASRWHDAAANGFDANTPEGTPVALFGFMSAVPDYRYHAGMLVPPWDYKWIVAGAARDWKNQNNYWDASGPPNPNAPILEPEFNFDNVHPQTVEEFAQAVGPRNGSLRPADDIFFIAPLVGTAGRYAGVTIARVAGAALGKRAVQKIAQVEASAAADAAGAAARTGVSGAESALQGAQLNRHLLQLERYGAAGSRTLENGRIRYYGNVDPVRTPGEMAGRRLVREWDPSSNATRTWHETVDHAGRVRQVRPETGGPKIHFRFDENGNYIGSW